MKSILKKPFGIEIKIIGASLLFGLLVWITDALFDSLIFDNGKFGDLLILNVPNHEIYIRSILLALLLGFGILVSKLVAARLRALKDLSLSEAKFASALKNAGDGIIATNIDGRITYMNSNAQNATGWNENEAKGNLLNEVFYVINDTTGEKAEDPVERTIREKKTVFTANHTILIRKDGGRTAIEYSASPVYDEENEFIGAVLVFRDISEKIAAEIKLRNSEQKYRSLIQTAPNVILHISPDHKILEFNPEAEKVFGYKRDDVLGKDYLELFIPEKDRKEIAAVIQKLLSGEASMGYENPVLTKDGRKRLFLWNVNRISGVDNEPTGIVAIGFDITDRKDAEDAIRESEKKFRNVVESSPMGMHFYRLEPDGRLVFEGANPAADKLLGIKNSQFIGKTIEEAFPGSIGTELPEKYRAAASRGEIWQSEQVNYVDKQIKGAFQVVAFQTTKNRMAAMFFDITEQKIIEKELKESEERFRSTFEQAAVGMAHVATNGNFIRVNQRFCDIVGYTRDELLKRNFQDITHPDDLERDVEFLRRLLSGDLKTLSSEKRYIRRDASIADVNLTTTMLRDAVDEPKYFITVIEDITERKRAEKILERTQFSVNHSIDAVYWTDSDARFVDVNETACRTLGYSRDEFLNMTFDEIDSNFPAEEWPTHWEELRRKGSIVIESDHRAKDGSTFPVELAINYLRIDGNEYICAFARDITERKKAEEALKESEEKFRNLAERSPNMIFINCRGKIVFVNEKCVEVMGYNKDEFYDHGFDFLSLIAPEYVPLINENLGRHMRGEDIQPYEYELISKNEERINSIISTKLIKYEGQESILGIVTDISEHKKAEKALKKSENDLVKAQRIAGIGSWEWDIARKEISWSEEMYRIYGIDNETELTVELIRGLIYPEDLVLFENAVSDFLNKIPPKSFEFRIIRPGGDILYVQSTAEAQYNGKGEPVSLIGTVQNITERKKAEELREKLIADLQKAANEIKTLTGFIPICASCKKIRDDKGYWEQIETYIMEHSNAEFSHGLCPECSKKLYPDL